MVLDRNVVYETDCIVIESGRHSKNGLCIN